MVRESLIQSDKSELRGYFSPDCGQISQEKCPERGKSLSDFKKAGRDMTEKSPQCTEVRMRQGFPKNPLRRRLLRELREGFGKYLVIFLLMTMTIGLVSGFLVADNSMITAYNESFQRYRVEDGHFRLKRALNKAQRKALEGFGIQVYDLLYADRSLTNGSTLRVFAQRQEVNLACLMEGRFPERSGEVAIDRMYADNNGIAVGDVLSDGARSWTVCGTVALSDYSALFSDNSDTMFDAVKFGVAVVCAEDFASFGRDSLSYCYAWRYDAPPEEEEQAEKRSEDLMKQMLTEVRLEEFVPRHQNQAIRFTGDDMGSDRSMMLVLLYLMIAILAFVFTILTDSTITREAGVIGTLRASGYTRWELVRHYMTLPMAVTLVGAAVGNALGYTVLKDVCADLYYSSYSLPTYVTLWNAEAFVLTTLVPLGLMAAVNLLLLLRRLRLSPLRFLRRELRSKRRGRAVPLSEKLPFFFRFWLRILFQNASGYAMLLVGIAFANLLLLFGLGLPQCLEHYEASIQENLLSPYQYILNMPLKAMDEGHKLESALTMLQFRRGVETEHEEAEKFTAYTLKTLGDVAREEDVMVYGVEPDSRFLPIRCASGEAYLSSAYADKFQLAAGDSITLREPFEEQRYTFRVAGVVDYLGALAVFLNREEANTLFDLGRGYFSGYFSDVPLEDLDKRYVGSVIDWNALTKVTRQLEVSMGSMMYLVDGFAVIIYLVLLYLLSKLILERSALSISLTKILGYSNGEIARLYLLATSVMVVLSLLITLPLVYHSLLIIFRKVLMAQMSGWIPLVLDDSVFVTIFALGLGSYGVVAALEYRRICAIPMDEALKNVE